MRAARGTEEVIGDVPQTVGAGRPAGEAQVDAAVGPRLGHGDGLEETIAAADDVLNGEGTGN